MKTIKRWLCEWLGIETAGMVLKTHDDAINNLSNSFDMLFDDVKDNERRIDRLEQCIYGLSISDDVKACDVKDLVKDMAHQMYGERAARGDDSADYPEEMPF